MNNKAFFIIVSIILLILVVWLLFKDKEDVIGYVTNLNDYVGHALSGEDIHPVNETEELLGDDIIRVKDGGEAQLTFGNIKIIAMSETEVDSLHTEGDPQTPALAHVLLRFGGLICNNEARKSELILTTPVDRKKVTVMGTWMFMVYDPITELTTVGNFDGTVHVDAGGEQTFIEPGKYVVIPAGQPPSDQFEIPFTLDQYQDFGDSGESAIDILLKYGMFTLEDDQPNAQQDLGTTENPLQWVFTPIVDQDSTYAGFEELAALIYEYSGLFVEPYLIPNSDVAIELMCAGEGQITSLQAIPYLLASKHGCAQADLVATRFGDIAYNSQIFVNDESGIQTLSELKGEFFCRPDSASPTGWLIPNLSLKAAGIDAEIDFYAIDDTGSHNTVVSAVYGYECVAGATYVDAREAVQQELPDVMDVVRVIYVSPDIPNDGVQLHPGLDEDLRSLLVDTLLEIANTDAGKELFDFIFAWEDLSPCDDTFYDGFRDLLDAANVPIEELN